MGYVELINKLETLPREKQAEVIEFVDFLAERCGTSSDKPLKRAEAAATPGTPSTSASALLPTNTPRCNGAIRRSPEHRETVVSNTA